MFGGEERLENHLLLLASHTLARIDQQQTQVAGRRRFRFDLDFQYATAGHRFQRIGKQTIEYLRQLHLLADHRCRGLWVVLHLYVATLDLRGKGMQGFLHGGGQVDDFTGIVDGPQRLQEFAHPLGHAIDLADDVFNVLARRFTRYFLGQFGTGADRGQRVAQAMGHGRRHLAHGDEGFIGDQLLLLGLQQA
ncbi:hypothetical protein D9M71_200920 [compost metagenome]